MDEIGYRNGKAKEMVTTETIRETGTDTSRKRRFLDSLAAKLTATALMKAGLLVLALILGTGVSAYLIGLHRSAPPRGISTGVVLTKLIDIGEFHAAEAEYTFNFTYVVHRPFLFFTGESIHLVGRGTDDAVINFSGLTAGQVLRPGTTSVSLVLPAPHLGTPAVDLSQTALSEEGGLFTHLSHLFENDPNDARAALASAQDRIAAAAANSQLIEQAKASTTTFLVKFLGRLGFRHVAVVFV